PPASLVIAPPARALSLPPNAPAACPALPVSADHPFTVFLLRSILSLNCLSSAIIRVTKSAIQSFCYCFCLFFQSLYVFCRCLNFLRLLIPRKGHYRLGGYRIFAVNLCYRVAYHSCLFPALFVTIIQQ